MSQIGYPPLRIDILNSIDGVTFTEAYQHKNILKLEDLEIAYIGLNDLIANKKASARSQALTDLKQLMKLAKKRNN